MYKPELKNELAKLISDFFIEERGNRVTTNNIAGFLAKVNIVLTKNENKKEK